MLPLLLLPLFLYFDPASSGNMCRHMHEFTTEMRILGTILSEENCSKNCNSVLNPNTTCRCFNVSDEECGSPDYFIKGLLILHSQLPSASSHITKLIGALKIMAPPCQIKMKCLLPVTISPIIFHETLGELAQQLSSTQ